MQITSVQNPLSDNTFVSVAGQDLAINRVVIIDTDSWAYYVDPTNMDHELKVVGLTMRASAIYNNCIIRTRGKVFDASWTWQTSLPVYVSTLGQLTQDIPTVGFVRQIGMAIDINSIFIDIKDSTTDMITLLKKYAWI